MTVYTFSVELYSDLYKDAMGCRPSMNTYRNFLAMSDAGKQAEWDNLCSFVEDNIEREKADRAAAIVAFKSELADVMKAGAPDEDTALRWMIQVEEYMDNEQDIESFVYFRGFLFTDYGKEIVKRLKELVL